MMGIRAPGKIVFILSIPCIALLFSQDLGIICSVGEAAKPSSYCQGV